MFWYRAPALARCARIDVIVPGKPFLYGPLVTDNQKEMPMTTIMPTDKNLRNAIAWIEERRHGHPDLKRLMAEAATHFNLTPVEELALAKFYREETAAL